MSAIQALSDVNFRSTSYAIARTRGRCPHCGVSTGLLALVLPAGHEALEAEAEPELEPELEADKGAGAHANAHAETSAGSDAAGSEVWQRADIIAFLFYVEHLPDDVRVRLNSLSQFFRVTHSKATLSSYWANHCEHCSRPLDDHDLHCEPEGAFMPASVIAAEAIELLHVAEPFEAAAAGYALEPEFFGFMRRSRPSWPSTF
jgi:hypothetical protein